MARLRHREKSRIVSALFAMTASAKIRMQLYFVMAVIWLFIKNATVFHISQKASGSVANASIWGGVYR